MEEMLKEGYIEVFRGDDSDALGYQTITATLSTTLDLTDCSAHFVFLDFTQDFSTIPDTKTLTITIPHTDSAKFPVGIQFASMYINDSDGKRRTFTTNIPVIVNDRIYNSSSDNSITVYFNPLPQMLASQSFSQSSDDWTFRGSLATIWKLLGGTVTDEDAFSDYTNCRFCNTIPSSPHTMDIAIIDNTLKYWNGTAWANFGGGVTDYDDLTSKPSINSVTLTGNKTLADLNIVIPTKTSQLTNDSITPSSIGALSTNGKAASATKADYATTAGSADTASFASSALSSNRLEDGTAYLQFNTDSSGVQTLVLYMNGAATEVPTRNDLLYTINGQETENPETTSSNNVYYVSLGSMVNEITINPPAKVDGKVRDWVMYFYTDANVTVHYASTPSGEMSYIEWWSSDATAAKKISANTLTVFYFSEFKTDGADDYFAVGKQEINEQITES